MIVVIGQLHKTTLNLYQPGTRKVKVILKEDQWEPTNNEVVFNMSLDSGVLILWLFGSDLK